MTPDMLRATMIDKLRCMHCVHFRTEPALIIWCHYHKIPLVPFKNFGKAWPDVYCNHFTLSPDAIPQPPTQETP